MADGGINTEGEEIGNVNLQKPQAKTGSKNALGSKDGQQDEAKLNQTLERERKLGDPKISVHIFHGVHERREDFDGLKEMLKAADIYMPEVVGWFPEILSTYRAISTGQINPELFLKEVSAVQLLKGWAYQSAGVFDAIYGTKIPISIADIPREHELTYLYDMEKQPPFEFGSGSFMGTINSFKQFFENHAVLEGKREEFILEQIRVSVKELLNEYPQLRDKNELRVVMSLGAGHANLSNLSSKDNYRMTRSFSELPFLFGAGNEAVLRYKFGGKIDDGLVARAVLEEAFFQAYSPLIENMSVNTQQSIVFRRKIASQFNFEEIKGMFEGVSRFDELVPLLISNLHKKGIRMPRSQQEMNDFLAKPLPRETAD